MQSEILVSFYSFSVCQVLYINGRIMSIVDIDETYGIVIFNTICLFKEFCDIKCHLYQANYGYDQSIPLH